MRATYYLDANGLLRWAGAMVATPTARDSRIGGVVGALIDGLEITAMSETTMLEVHSNILKDCRDNSLPAHDQAWADRAVREIMVRLEDGRLTMLPVPPKLAEMAMANIELTSRLQTPAGVSLKIRAWDAAHLYQAVRWARQINGVVTLVTSDADLLRAATIEPAFNRHLAVLDPSL